MWAGLTRLHKKIADETGPILDISKVTNYYVSGFQKIENNNQH